MCHKNDRFCIKKSAFTLAEVLITLGIIGVIAAVLLPSILDNINDKKYAAARLKALKTIGEAVKNIAATEGIGNATDAEDFVENHLKKQISMIKTCKNNNLRSCGIETNLNEITTLSEAHTKITMPKKIGDLAAGSMQLGQTIDVNSTSYGFVMSNGYCVNIFYNPNCMSDDNIATHLGQDRVCVNAIYDMNGLARPNEVGKDIGFVTVIYPDEQVVSYAPNVYIKSAGIANFNNAAIYCQNLDKNLFVPNRDELLSMYYNNNLLEMAAAYWSANEISTDLAWHISFHNGYRRRYSRTYADRVRCIKRDSIK